MEEGREVPRESLEVLLVLSLKQIYGGEEWRHLIIIMTPSAYTLPTLVPAFPTPRFLSLAASKFLPRFFILQAIKIWGLESLCTRQVHVVCTRLLPTNINTTLCQHTPEEECLSVDAARGEIRSQLLSVLQEAPQDRQEITALRPCHQRL